MPGVKRKPPAPQVTKQEVDFPRGGGTKLTPFEHQQVLREVKAEANAAKKARIANSTSDDLFKEGDQRTKLDKQRANRERKNAIKKKSTVSKKPINGASKANKEASKGKQPKRVEYINYKRLNSETRLLCCIQAVYPLYLVLSMPSRMLGRVPITSISSVFTSRLERIADDDSSSSSSSASDSDDGEDDKEMPELRQLFSKGQWVVASVVKTTLSAVGDDEDNKFNSESQKVELTIDPKIVNDAVSASDLSSGYLLPMAVKSKEDNGYLMDTGIANLDGFISFKDTNARSLQIGQVVNASIVNVHKSITATLNNTKTVNSQIKVAPSIAALLPGHLLRVLVVEKTKNGLIVKLFGLFDASISTYDLDGGEEDYEIGQHVIARILWTNMDSLLDDKKIALNARKHIVNLGSSKTDSKIVKTEANVKDAKQVKEKINELSKPLAAVQKESAIIVQGSDEDDDSDDAESSSSGSGESEDRSSSSESEVESEEESKVESEAESEVVTKRIDRPALELPRGLGWSAGVPMEDSSDSEDEEEIRVTTNTKKRKGKATSYQEDLTATLSTKTPDTSQDFDRLLLASPNSSYLWIQYMSFQLQLGDVAKGREIGRRALQVINFREEQEKFNVWIALLNLENTFGSEESLEEAYREACAYNDDKKISLCLAEILSKSGKDAEEYWRRVIKKHGKSSKVWIEYYKFLLGLGKEEEARGMIPRSMQSLEKRKHIKTIVACALNDFKMDGVERGRTIFEGLVDTYPKRLDLWWQYIDQESRVKNTSGVRELFERILSMKLSSKKVKSILKKWLEFEKTNGDEKGQQKVLERARRFVEEKAADGSIS